MAVTLNASITAGLVQTADTSGNLSLQSAGTTKLAVTSTGVAVTGLLSATNYLSVASGGDNVGVSGASFGYSATYGTSIVSGTGTNNDFVLWKRGGLAAIMSVSTNSTTVTFGGLILPQQAATASAPAYVKGAIYFDTTLNKLRVGGATAWETITSA